MSGSKWTLRMFIDETYTAIKVRKMPFLERICKHINAPYISDPFFIGMYKYGSKSNTILIFESCENE